MIWLLIYVLVIGLYDLRTRRIPNWYTLPLILVGIISHFPGHLDVWFASFALLSAWASDWMGAGDVKVWMAVLWNLPGTSTPSPIVLFFISFFLTGLAQILWRTVRRQPASGSKSPAAWRTIPFLLMFWYVH